VKEDFKKDMENFRKMNQREILEIHLILLNQIKTTVESFSSRLYQVEERISGLKNKIDINEKKTSIFRQKIQELRKEHGRTQQFY
jgi:hypothetical protein